MEECPRFYAIRIQGCLHPRWMSWFDGMTVTNLDPDEMVIEGPIQDQSALVGFINQIHALNLTLISVHRLDDQK